MQIGSVIAIYFVTWWVCLFVVLPFGVRNQVDAGVIVPGTDPGAPAVLRLWPKLLINSVVAAIIVALIAWGWSNPALQAYMS